jgi:serine-type D-Ala-D-Ala carboxypeptidase (penicillin-binding protein 5/6)
VSDRYRTRRSPLRALWVALVTVVILAVPLYGVVCLLPPLPAGTLEPVELAGADGAAAPDTGLPAGGASALVTPDGALVAATGDTAPVPMAGSAKTVLALVTLSVYPLAPDEPGENIAIGAADVDGFATLQNQGARVVPVTLGDTYTQRELLAAVLVGGSNNLADTLARWAFGSVDAYLDAARGWLADRDLDGTTVVDPRGIDPANTATASDLARIAALAGTDPTLAAILAGETLTGDRAVEDYIGYRQDLGITVVSRGYTDAAGVCVLLGLPVPALADAEGVGADRVWIAMLGQSGYPSASAALDALATRAPEAIAPVTLVAAGSPVARYTAPWGDATDLVTSRDLTVLAVSGAVEVMGLDVPAFTTIAADRPAGELVVAVGGAESRFGLRSVDAIRDPGLGWRLAHPGAMLAQALGSVGGGGG